MRAKREVGVLESKRASFTLEGRTVNLGPAPTRPSQLSRSNSFADVAKAAKQVEEKRVP